MSERRSAAVAELGVPVALSVDLPKKRTFMTTKADGVGLLLTRDRNGVVHAFRNQCLHRDRPVIDGCGRSSKVTCGKHGWKYDLEGKLLSKKSKASKKALPPLVVTEHDGWIWVSLGG